MKKQINREHFYVIFNQEEIFIYISEILKKEIDIIVESARCKGKNNLIGYYKKIPIFCHSYFYFGQARENIFIQGMAGEGCSNIKHNNLIEVKKL